MTRQLSPKSSPEALRREAKRWYKAVVAGDVAARERLQAAWPAAPSHGAGLRDVQHALAREYAQGDWSALIATATDRQFEWQLERQSHEQRIHTLLSHGWHGDVLAARRLAVRFPDVRAHSLFTAATCGDVQAVRELLARDSTLSTATFGPQRWTALAHVAYGRVDDTQALAIAALLLDAGADPRFAFDDGWGNAFTLVTGAIGQGEGAKPAHAQARELVELFHSRGADPNDLQALYNSSIVHDDITWTAMLWSHCERAGRTGEWRIAGGRSLGASFGLSTLDYLLGNAVAQNHLQRASWLLAQGANARTLHAYARQPVHTMAVMAGHERMAALLRAHGAEMEALDGERALVAALMRGDAPEVRARVAADPALMRSVAPLMAVATHDRADGVRLLLSLGADVNAVDHDGATPLHRAAHAGALQAIDVLLEAGAAVDVRDRKWQGTPMSWACVLGRPLVADRLAPLTHDVRALVRTARVERLEEVLREWPHLSIERLAGVDEPTPLFCLPPDEDDALEVVRLLLEHGADRSARDGRGRTPADVARAKGMTEVAAVLGGLRYAGRPAGRPAFLAREGAGGRW